MKPAGTSLVSDAEFQHRAAMLMQQVEYIARLPTDKMVRSTQQQMLSKDYPEDAAHVDACCNGCLVL